MNKSKIFAVTAAGIFLLLLLVNKAQAYHSAVVVPSIPRITCKIVVLGKCRQAVFLGTSCPTTWTPGQCI